MEQRAYWERHAKAFADLYERPTWFTRVFRRALRLRARMALEEVRRTPGAAVLDVGCGPGHNSVLFAKEGGAARVVGVDIAEDMIRMARELAAQHGVADRCRFLQADFLDVDLGGERFDYSVALGVMDYLRDPLPLVRKMREVTARAAVASFPGFAPVRMALRKVRYGLRGVGVYWYWRAEIERLFAEAGFAAWRVERCTRAGWIGRGFCEASGAAAPAD